MYFSRYFRQTPSYSYLLAVIPDTFAIQFASIDLGSPSDPILLQQRVESSHFVTLANSLLR